MRSLGSSLLFFIFITILFIGCGGGGAPLETNENIGPPYTEAYTEKLFSDIDGLYDAEAASLVSTDSIYTDQTEENIYLMMKNFSGSSDMSLSIDIGSDTYSGIADADLIQSLTSPFLVRFTVSPTFYFDYASGTSTPVLTGISRLSITQANATDITSLTTTGDGFSIEMPCDQTACTETCSCECKRLTTTSDAWTTSDITTIYTEGDPTVTCEYFNSDFYVAAFANYGCAIGSMNATTGRAPCILCQEGKFASSVGSTSCLDCDYGTYAAYMGSSVCTNCAAGSYGPSTGSSSCISCAPGSFNTIEGSTTCATCSAGQFQSNPGSTSCSDCDAGKFSSSNGATICDPCPAGEFNSSTGQTSCSPCEPGRFSAGTGATACSLCTPGNFSASSGASTCNPCPSDTYQPSSGGSSCLSCPGASPGSSTCI